MAREPDFATPEEERAYLERVNAQLDKARSKEEVVTIWREHYLRIGHRKLGRLLIGRSIAEILKRRG